MRYQTGQGAKFAASLAQLPATVELSQKDVNYLFHKGIIFTSEDFERLNQNYEIVFSPPKLIKIALTLIWGVITMRFSLRSLITFMKASSLAGKIKAHYLDYPKDPADFQPWADRAKRLWNETGTN
jgi:pyruvate-formate lyase-activating enzyme